MISLSLDQALNITGWCIWENNKPIKIDNFKTKKTAPIEQRLNTIWQQLCDLYAEYEFDYLAFEDIQQQGNPQTYKRLAYVQATIMLWCYFNDVKYDILAPSHWRSVLGGTWGRKREEQKEYAINYVKEQYGIAASSDEADAVCIGAAALKEKDKNKSAF